MVIKRSKGKIFVICPVRNITKLEQENLEKYISRKEKEGWIVHYPPRDTKQDDPIGWNICRTNRQAIMNSDEIHIFWNTLSQGSLFDLGMAFSLHKKIILINKIKKTPEKSFSNVLLEWSRNKEK